MAIHDLVDVIVERPLILLPVIACIIIYAFSGRPDSVYDNYEQLKNPWWLPNLLGKGPHVLFSEGYNNIIVPHDKPFVVKWWSLWNLILPPRYLRDLTRVKSTDASFLKNFSDAVNLQHSVGTLYESDRMGDILRHGMNPTLPTLIPLIEKEIDKAIATEIGNPQDWKTFKTVETFIMISHRVVSRLLAGKELAESEEFIHLSHKFSESVFTTGLITAELPLGPFRPLVGWMLAQYHRITLYRLMKITEPVVAKRMHSGKTSPEQNDSIEWAIKLNSDDKRDSRVVSLEMLHILEAAGGAPGAMMSEMMYQMLIEPSWFSVLQDEIKKVVKADSPLASQLDSLPLMDSFIMETNRMYPVGGVTAARTVMNNPWVLHDGTTLPVGTRIGFPCKAIQLDPANFKDPLKFNGYRFARLNDAEKKGGDEATTHLATSVTATNLSWGFGKHACPGRFYAIKLAKMVYMVLLEKYEFKWDGKPREEHPASFEVQGQFLPNMEAKICIRRREHYAP